MVSERKVYEVEKDDTLSGISLKLLGNADLWNEKLYKENGDTFTRGEDELIVPGQKVYYYEEDVEEKDEDSDLQVKEMEDIFTKTSSKAANEREKKIKEEWQQEEWNIGDSEYKLPPYKQYSTFKQEDDQEIQDLKFDFRKELEASYFNPLVNDMESNIVISSVINKSIDEDNLPAPIRNRLHYILNKILTLEEGETVVEEMNNAYFTGTVEYTRDDYIREYRELEKFIESPFFQVANGVTVKVVNVFEALSQAYAGYTEAVIGKQFVDLGGGIVATGLGTVAGGTVVAGIGVIVGGIIVLGTGAYLMVDGISNFVEGADKLALDAGVDIMSWQEESFNPLEDLGYETVWGEEKGELYYNRASLGAGLICIGKDLYDIGDDILNSNKIHRCVRKRQTAKARRLNLETETVLEYRKYKGNKLVMTLREVNPNTATPMILERTFVEVPELVKGVGKGAGATLNDVKNTKGAFEGSTIDEKN